MNEISASLNSKPSCRIMVGTSGYSYAEWSHAGFYPAGTKSSQMLPLYAKEFEITELNYTWYQMPKADSLERMLNIAPPGFNFTAKLTRSMTHEILENEWRGQVFKYRQGFLVHLTLCS